MRKPIRDESCYSVTCPSCNLTETMIFKGGSLIPIPSVRRHLPTVTHDEGGNEIENVFKPIKGSLGDKPPTYCPICKTLLTIKPITLRH